MSVFSCNTVCSNFTVILIEPDYVYELITCLSLAVTLSVFISLLFSLYQIMYIN